MFIFDRPGVDGRQDQLEERKLKQKLHFYRKCRDGGFDISAKRIFCEMGCKSMVCRFPRKCSEKRPHFSGLLKAFERLAFVRHPKASFRS